MALTSTTPLPSPTFVDTALGSPLATQGLAAQAWHEMNTLEFTSMWLQATGHHRGDKAWREGKRLASVLHRADKHYIADDLAERIQLLTLSEPHQLLQMATLARPRFDTMWIEWNNAVRMAATTPSDKLDTNNMALRRGVLIESAGDHWRAVFVNRIMGEDRQGHIALWPVGLDFDFTGSRPMAVPNEATHCALGGGYISHYMGADEKAHAADLLRLQSLAAQAPGGPLGVAWHAPHQGEDAEINRLLREESQGDARFLLVLLAMLACNPVVNTTVIARGASKSPDLSPGRYYPKWERKVVKLVRTELALPELRATVVDFARGSAGDRRLHKVTGSWHQSRKKGSDHCEHVWQPRLNAKGERVGSDQYHCAKCSRTRWWHPPHYRGTAFEGRVEKEYEVTIG